MPTKGWTCPLRVSIAMRMTCSRWPVGPRRMTDVEWIGPSLRRDSKPRVTSRHRHGTKRKWLLFSAAGFWGGLWYTTFVKIRKLKKLIFQIGNRSTYPLHSSISDFCSVSKTKRTPPHSPSAVLLLPVISCPGSFSGLLTGLVVALVPFHKAEYQIMILPKLKTCSLLLTT